MIKKVLLFAASIVASIGAFGQFEEQQLIA